MPESKHSFFQEFATDFTYNLILYTDNDFTFSAWVWCWRSKGFLEFYPRAKHQLAEIRSLSLGWEIHTPSPPSQTWYIFLWQKIGQQFLNFSLGNALTHSDQTTMSLKKKNFCWDGTPDASFQRNLSVFGLLSISDELDWCSQQTPHIITHWITSQQQTQTIAIFWIFLSVFLGGAPKNPFHLQWRTGRCFKSATARRTWSIYHFFYIA